MARKTAITEPRHHSARPVSNISPNPLVNSKPNFVPAEASAINVNPSLGTVGLDTVNGRVYGGKFGAPDPALAVARDGGDDCSDPNIFPEDDPSGEDMCPEDRLKLS